MNEIDSTYRPHGENLASTVIDGDAVLVNLATGVYYSLDGTAGTIWQMIEQEQSVGAIAAQLASAHDVSEEQSLADVQNLIEQLLKEDLIVKAENAGAPSATPEAPGERTAYVAPQMSVYTDMSDLLALDPPMPGLQANPGSSEGRE